MSNKDFDDIFGDLFKRRENLTSEQLDKIREKNKREREKINQLAKENHKKQIESYLSKKINYSLIYNLDFIDSDTFKSILAKVAQVCFRRQHEIDTMFLLSVMNTALNIKKIEPFNDINELLNFCKNTNSSVEEKSAVYEYIRCCLQKKIERYPEMKQNAILIGEILMDVENIDKTFSDLFGSFKR